MIDFGVAMMVCCEMFLMDMFGFSVVGCDVFCFEVALFCFFMVCAARVCCVVYFFLRFTVHGGCV